MNKIRLYIDKALWLVIPGVIVYLGFFGVGNINQIREKIHSLFHAAGNNANQPPTTGTNKEKIADTNSYISNKSFYNLPDEKEMIVEITDSYKRMSDDDKKINQKVNQEIVSLASDKGYRASSAFFTKKYYNEQLGDQIISGDTSIFTKLNLASYADYLLVGKYSLNTTGHEGQNNDFPYVVINISLQLFDIKKGLLLRTINVPLNESGTSMDGAIDNDIEVLKRVVYDEIPRAK